MIVHPAIDLIDGEVVRLVEGDFERKTVFSSDPLTLLKGFADQGAKFAHLVDLSGAKDPARRQTALISRLLKQVPLKIQIGGGIRSLQEIETLLEAGADRVVIGSMTVTEPKMATAALEKFTPEKLTFALDVRLNEDGIPMVMSHGWLKATGLTFAQALAPFELYGLKRVLCTDISVDGRAVGPNVKLYEALRKQFPSLELQASGGVSSITDLQALAKANVHSVVVGRALLTGAFTLTEALAHAQ
jgi:phosphoribosylformimino-5-aminoimidazole carboxamide ribotide isomerase